MFIDKQLGQDRKWINIDSDLIAENSYLYKKYDIKELAHVSILFFIRAYCTMKGVKMLDEELNSLPLS